MTDEELEKRIRQVSRRAHEDDAFPELDAPISADVLRSIVERHSDAEAPYVEPPAPANRRWWVVALAVAAAVLIGVATLFGPTQGAYPTYELSGQTGVSLVRAPSDRLIATPDKPVRLLLRPSTRTDTVPGITARIGQTAVPIELQSKPGGAVLVTLGAMPPGVHTVELEVGFDGGPRQQLAVDVEVRR